ncbi:MAG: serine hydrolase domain-containing protein [Cellulosilyticaceae bacterium]
MRRMDTTKLAKLFQSVTKAKDIEEGFLYVEDTEGEVHYTQSYGGRELDTPMVMASITKLFTTACILALIEEGKLGLAYKVAQYFDEETMKGLHTYKGKDYATELTIKHLLCQTSGLPDYYLEGKAPLFKRVIKEDFGYTFEEALSLIKGIDGHFQPGKLGKAYYSDFNFDLLGKIIEGVTHGSLEEAYAHFIFKPLGLEHTYVMTDERESVPPVYYKEQKLERPLFLRSCGASGGGMTTPRELMTFLKAFWKGGLFNIALLEELKTGNSLQLSFYPLHYAGGYMHIEAGYPWGKKTTLVGHSGSTGSFAFYAPEKDLFFVGDVPQIARPTGVRLVMQAVVAIG